MSNLGWGNSIQTRLHRMIGKSQHPSRQSTFVLTTFSILNKPVIWQDWYTPTQASKIPLTATYINVSIWCDACLRAKDNIFSTFFKYREWYTNTSCDTLNQNARVSADGKLKQWEALCCLMSHKMLHDASCQIKQWFMYFLKLFRILWPACLNGRHEKTGCKTVNSMNKSGVYFPFADFLSYKVCEVNVTF